MPITVASRRPRVVADPHVQPRTLRSAPSCVLDLLDSGHGAGHRNRADVGRASSIALGERATS